MKDHFVFSNVHMKQFGNKLDVLFGIGLAVVVIVLTLLGSFCDFMLAIANTKGFVWIQIDNVVQPNNCVLLAIANSTRMLPQLIFLQSPSQICEFPVHFRSNFWRKKFRFFYQLKRSALKFQAKLKHQTNKSSIWNQSDEFI